MEILHAKNIRFDIITLFYESLYNMSEFRKAIPYIPDSLQNRAKTVECLPLILKHFQIEFAAQNVILNRYYRSR